MSKKNKYKGDTMSNETQEQTPAVDLEVPTQEVAETQPAETQEPATPETPAPAIVQEAEVETPKPEKKPEEIAKKITEEDATKTSARIAQKPTKNSNIESLQSNNPRVRQFAYQVNQYIALCNKPCITEAALNKKIEQFTFIMRVIINSTDPAVYSAAYQFFKNHRKDILSESCVFQNVHNLPTELSIRIQTLYTVFMELAASNVDKKPFRLDYGLIRDNMKFKAQHPFLNWIRNRLSR